MEIASSIHSVVSVASLSRSLYSMTCVLPILGYHSLTNFKRNRADANECRCLKLGHLPGEGGMEMSVSGSRVAFESSKSTGTKENNEPNKGATENDTTAIIYTAIRYTTPVKENQSNCPALTWDR